MLRTLHIYFYTFPFIFIIHTWWTNQYSYIFILYLKAANFHTFKFIIYLYVFIFKDGNMQEWRKSIKNGWMLIPSLFLYSVYIIINIIIIICWKFLPLRCEQTTTVISIYFWVAFEVTQLSSAIHDFPCYNYLSVLVPGFDWSLDLTEIGILKKLLTY